MTARPLDVVYVIGTHPRLTTTFIDREIEALRRLGLEIQVVSLRRPDPDESAGERAQEVEYVLPVSPAALVGSHASFLLRRPGVYLRTLLDLVTAPHPSVAARVKTFLHFGMAVHVASLVRDRYPAPHLHAHFVDRAALVALVAGRLLDLPFTATAHANDIYVSPVLLPEKLREARATVTCTRANRDHLQAVAGPEVEVLLVHHGLDTSVYSPLGRREDATPLVLSVAQLREKKGLTHLLQACRHLLDRGVELDCEIVGEGPLRAELERRIGELGLERVVTLRGALPPEQVLHLYRRAAVFALPSVTAADGDRDGIPNVILEAMATGVPVVSTDNSSIPEAVASGEHGLLVPPGDADALADAIERLLSDRALRQRLAESARRRVLEEFDVDANAKQLLGVFERGVGPDPIASPLGAAGGRALFLVWGPPSHGPRTKVFARELGIEAHFLSSIRRRGVGTAPLRYLHQALSTVWLLARRRPRTVFVQSPPNLAPFVVSLYCSLTGARFVVDAHSAALQAPFWTRPRWLNRYVARRAVATIVTNPGLARIVEGWGGKALVIPDVPTSFPLAEVERADGFQVLVVNSFAPDEPIGEVVAAAGRLPDVTFLATGDVGRAPHLAAAPVPPNFRFTGFLPDDEYYGLMAGSDAVMCLTTRDDTMQRGACEALALGRPVITSDWPVLRDYFSAGTVHVGAGADSIEEGVARMREEHSRFRSEIVELRERNRRRWDEGLAALREALEEPRLGEGAGR